MSNENQKPTSPTEQAQSSDKVSPFLSSPLPQGIPQGQQQSLQQTLTDTPVSGSVRNTIYHVVQATLATLVKQHTLVIQQFELKTKHKSC